MSREKYRAVCHGCKIPMDSLAEAMIHDKLHNGRPEWADFGDFTKLNALPFALFPIVAKLMEAYAEAAVKDAIGVE
jgi:hypothetical protein